MGEHGSDRESKTGVDRCKIATTLAWERLGPKTKLTSTATVPPSAEAITAEWLTSVLCVGTDAKVATV
jgi:hypothetical protein